MVSTGTATSLGRYELYKAGTKKIVDWLTLNASRCVDISQFITCRKAKTRNIKVRSLISLAEAIVLAHRSSDPPATDVVVTSTIVRLVREVIAGRQASAEWYAMQPTSAEAVELNEQHTFFIGVLQKVHDLLISIQQPREFRSEKEKAGEENTTNQKPNRDFENLFSQLALEEPSQSPLGNAPEPVSRLKSATVTIDLDDGENDKTFALWCHLEDLRDIRRFVEGVWRDYATGEVSILAAAMVMETAFGFMRVSDERFVSIYGDFGDWWFLPKFLSFETRHCGRLTYIFSRHSKSNVTSAADPGKDLTDLISPSSAILLRDIARKVSDVVDEDVNIPRKRTMLRMSSTCYHFSEFLGNNVDELAAIVFLSRNGISNGIKQARGSRTKRNRDEFTDGLLAYFESGKAPIWLVSACQLYSSVYEVIGSNPQCASEAYLNTMVQMEAQIGAWRQNHTTLSDDIPWLSWLQNAFEFRRVIEPIMRVTQTGLNGALANGIDHDLLAFHAGVRSVREIRTVLGRPLLTMEGMPCSAGGLLYHVKIGVHRMRLNLSNQHVAILATAHLYTAARKYGLIKGTWHDLELVLFQQKSAQRPLVPKASKAADAFTPLRHYLLCLGVPAAEFSRGRIPELPTAKEIRKNSRKISVTSRYMIALGEEILSAHRLGFSRGHIEENILIKLAKNSGTASTKAKNGNGLAQHSMTELLSTFKSNMVKDEPFLHFDYLTLCSLCSAYLAQVSNTLDPFATQRASEPWAIVHRLLQEATTADSKSRPVASTSMGVAARTMETFIAANGNKLSQEAFNQSSGRIPKDLRPNLVSRREPQDGPTSLFPASIHMSVGVDRMCLYEAHGSDERFEEIKQAVLGTNPRILEPRMGLPPPFRK